MIRFDTKDNYMDYLVPAIDALDLLESKKGAGNEFLGWLNLPSNTPDELLNECDEIVERWTKEGVEIFLVIGIGGSYLGSKAAIEALKHPFSDIIKPDAPKVVFAGFNLSEDYMAEVIDLLKDRSFAIVVISKSGTTTEPAVAFRVFKKIIEERYGKKESARRIVAITDKSRGALKTLAQREGYKTFVIEDDIGGRFSVLSPVGLLPLALAGYNIKSFMKGAREMEKITSLKSRSNPAIRYAAWRNKLYDKGKRIEILVNYNPKLQYIAEWWKQLFGESEGKDGRGIFPASVNNTADLHSMGQYIQEGERLLFETTLVVNRAQREVIIENDPDDLDGLNFISGQHIEHCNTMARLGTMLAHESGGVPNGTISLETIDEFTLGGLFYFFEKACGISAYMLGVNPFNQPGVEAYKKNMFALLDKPGYEEEGERLRKRLQ